jgi:hypothetical protein
MGGQYCDYEMTQKCQLCGFNYILANVSALQFSSLLRNQWVSNFVSFFVRMNKVKNTIRLGPLAELPSDAGLSNFLVLMTTFIIIIIIAVTAQFVVWTVYSRSKVGIAGLNPAQGVHECLPSAGPSSVFGRLRPCCGPIPPVKNPARCLERNSNFLRIILNCDAAHGRNCKNCR